MTENPLADIVECCRRLEGWEVVNDDSLVQIPFCCNPAKDTLVQFALISPIKIGVFQCYGSTFVVDDFFLCAEFHFLFGFCFLVRRRCAFDGFNNRQPAWVCNNYFKKYFCHN